MAVALPGGEVDQEGLAVVVRGAQERRSPILRICGEPLLGGVGEHHGRGARVDGGTRIAVAVAALALEGDEERTGLDLARIDDRLSGHTAGTCGDDLRRCCLGKVLDRDVEHFGYLVIQ